MTLSRTLFSAVLALGLFIGVPALASHDDDNDNDNERAELIVYVEVEDRYNDNNYDPEDFTIEVDGENVSPDSFRGDEDGRRVRLDEGDYEVTVRNDRGYRATYSSGCEGDIDEGDTERCRITLEDRDNYFNSPYPQYPIYTTPAVTLQKGYIPGLPSTGFPPLSPQNAAFAIAAVVILGFFTYPYARKAFTAVLR